MGKKISKHSRAARRGELAIESAESKALSDLPRLQKTDTISPIIRSSILKNEQLLRNKLLKNSPDLNKRKSNIISKAIRTKKKKFSNINGRLGHKIENSIKRNKIVSSLRKTNWDKINELTKTSINNELINRSDSLKKTNTEIENDLLMELDDDEAEVDGTNDKTEIENDNDDNVSTLISKPNAFELLPEDDDN